MGIPVVCEPVSAYLFRSGRITGNRQLYPPKCHRVFRTRRRATIDIRQSKIDNLTTPPMTSDDSMDEPTTGFQWKWVILSLLMYLIFYFLPLMLVPGGIIAGGVANELSMYVIGIWGTAGVFIISAVMAYFSPGITVWEAVVSAVGVVILMVVVLSLETSQLLIATTSDAVGFVIILLVVFGMAYMGGWWGERLQNIREIIEDHPMDLESVEEAAEHEEKEER